LLISLGAFGVDAMLPALSSLASTLRVGETQAQLVVGAYLLGFSWGQLLFGPLSDAWGRRPVLLGALGLLWLSHAALPFIRDFGVLVSARAFQGLLASSLRTVGTAWVRDRYRGEAMARVMALVQSVFVVAPVLAPWVGAYLARLGWQAVFAFLAVVGCALWAWALARLEETLPPQSRRPLAWRPLWEAAAAVARTPESLVGTGLLALTYGMLYAYLVTAPQLYKAHLGLSNEAFAAAFAGTALFQLMAMLATRALVGRLGVRRLVRGAAVYLCLVTLLLPLHAAGVGSVVLFWLHLSLAFFGITLTFPNATSLALERLGRVAGFASSTVGFASTFVAGLVGNALGQWSGGDPRRFAWGWAALGAATFLLSRWAGCPAEGSARKITGGGA
jgi:DHA1 family bicyclomycin/chloramphenicol resistance-like MFS transporter